MSNLLVSLPDDLHADFKSHMAKRRKSMRAQVIEWIQQEVGSETRNRKRPSR